MKIVKRKAHNETNRQLLATYIIHLIENRKIIVKVLIKIYASMLRHAHLKFKLYWNSKI